MEIINFIDCTSLSFSYDVMGLVTVSYTVTHENMDFCYTDTIKAGGRTFRGEIIALSLNRIHHSILIGLTGRCANLAFVSASIAIK